jgi:hypothetical protein
MQTFNIPPSRAVGELKEALKDAVLDGKIKNDFPSALNFIRKLGKEKGLQAVK